MQNTKDSFFSMDRLIEFGMGMAMSQQIAQSMNNMMCQMRQPTLTQNIYQPLQEQNRTPVYQQYATQQQVSQNPTAFSQAGKTARPVSPPPIPQNAVQSILSIPEVFFISTENKKTKGPFCITEIARLVGEKKITAETLIWKNGTTEWKKAQDFTELLALIALIPPELTN
jgi:hypothetical protein